MAGCTKHRRRCFIKVPDRVFLDALLWPEARRSACRLQQQSALSGQCMSVIPSRGPARSVDPTPLCTSSNPKKALAAAHKEAALFQVEGLDDLAPLAATAPPGVPDLPEGDIIALGDEVGASMMIISIVIIGIIIIMSIISIIYHYCYCQRCCHRSMALATLRRGPSYPCSRPRRNANDSRRTLISTLLGPEPWWRRTGCDEHSTLQQHTWPAGMRCYRLHPPCCLGGRRWFPKRRRGVLPTYTWPS